MTRHDIASYIADVTKELARMAKEAGMLKLESHLLESHLLASVAEDSES